MPTSGRGESRRSSKSGASGNDAYKSSERREKAKSSQVYDSRRRGSKQSGEGRGAAPPERPTLKGRTNSAPVVERRGGQPDRPSKGPSSPRLDEDAQDEDEVAGVVGAADRLQLVQQPEVRQVLGAGTMDAHETADFRANT
jgi:hypothetical protein